MGIVSEPTKFERIHQLPRYTLSFSSVAMCVVLVRQFVHLANHFFSATQFQHGLSEPCITNEPIVNAQELSVSYISFGVDSQYGILYHLLCSRTCDRVAGPS